METIIGLYLMGCFFVTVIIHTLTPELVKEFGKSIVIATICVSWVALALIIYYGKEV